MSKISRIVLYVFALAVLASAQGLRHSTRINAQREAEDEAAINDAAINDAADRAIYRFPVRVDQKVTIRDDAFLLTTEGRYEDFLKAKTEDLQAMLDSGSIFIVDARTKATVAHLDLYKRIYPLVQVQIKSGDSKDRYGWIHIGHLSSAID